MTNIGVTLEHGIGSGVVQIYTLMSAHRGAWVISGGWQIRQAMEDTCCGSLLQFKANP